MKQPLRKKSTESGVALLFAIGLLALMIMLCVSFSMESLQSQKSANNNSHRSAAKTLAMSAVNHVSTAIMKYRDQYWDSEKISFGSGLATNVMPVDYSIISSRDGATTDNDQLGDLLRFRTAYIGKNYGGENAKSTGETSYETAYNTTGREPNWVYVKGKTESDGTAPVVGRFAYRVLPPASPTNINYSYYIGGNQKMAGGESAEWMNDISFVGKGNADTSYLAAAPLDLYAAAKKITKKDFDLAIRFFGDGAVPGDLEVFQITNGTKSYFCHRYNIAQAPVVTGSSDDDKVKSLIDKDEAKKRLNFFAFDELVDTKKTTGVTDSNIDRSYYQEKNAKDSDKKTNLFFLGMIANEKEPTSFSSVENRRKQIAANYLDYCDEDSNPTSDVDPSGWGIDMTSLPTYTGNEKTLYINEIALTSKFDASLVSATSSTSIDVKFYPGLAAELIDIYGNIEINGKKLGDMGESESVGKLSCGISNIKVNFTGTAKFKGGAQDRDINIDQPIDFGKVDFKDLNILKGSGNGGYYSGLSEKYESSSGNKNSDSSIDNKIIFDGLEAGEYIDSFTLKVSSITVTFKAPVVLQSGGANVDLVKMPTTPVSVTVSMADDAALTKDNGSAYITIGNMSAKDPRQNLNVDIVSAKASNTGANWKKSDWIFDPTAVVNSNAVTGMTMAIEFDATSKLPKTVSGAHNAYANPKQPTGVAQGSSASLEGDLEATVDPAYRGSDDDKRISTAYIRNAPMKSMWELGLIHRGAAWETINLQGSSVTPENLYTYLSGGSFDGTSYEEGDAAILDTVKVTDYAVSWGMIDVNMFRSNYPGFDYTGENTDKKFFDDVLLSIVKHSDPENVLKEGEKNKTIFEAFGDDVREKFISVLKPETVGTLTRRSQISNLYDGVFDTNFPTDSSREELIGKLMPVLKTMPALVTVFHVDIVAQTIKDVGGVSVSKLRQDGKLSKPANTTLGKFDLVEDGKDAEKEMVYLDEITGQVKLRATFDCNPFTGKIKLRQIKYLD